MSDATTQPRSNTSAGTISGATIRADEAAHFGRLAKDWWDPKGSSAMLHRLNPVRLQFLREAIDLHWAGDIEARQPLAGRRGDAWGRPATANAVAATMQPSRQRHVVRAPCLFRVHHRCQAVASMRLRRS